MALNNHFVNFVNKMLGVLLITGFLFVATKADASNVVAVTLTSPGICKSGSCQPSGAVSLTFEAGSELSVGDWWYMDLPTSVPFCKPIDYIIGNNAQSGTITVSSTDFSKGIFDAANSITSMAPGQSCGPLSVKDYGADTGITVTGSIAIRVKAAALQRRVYFHVIGDPEAKIQVGSGAGLEMTFLNHLSYKENIFTDPDGDGVYAYNSLNDEINAGYIQVDPSYPGDLIYVSFASKADKFTFTGDALLAHEVSSCKELPLADAGPDQTVENEVTLDAGNSSDPDGEIVSYEWQLAYRGNPSKNIVAEGVSPVIGTLCQGTYDVLLTVTDNDNGRGTDKMVLQVTTGASCVVYPVAVPGDHGQLTESHITLDGSLSYDPQGRKIVSYQWELINRDNPAYNKTAEGKIVTITDIYPGTYDLVLTVENDLGLTGKKSQPLIVSNQANSQVQITLTSPAICNNRPSKTAGAILFSFEPGSVLQAGAWWAADLPKYIEIAEPIDTIISGNATVGNITIHADTLSAVFDPGTTIPSMTPDAKIGPMSVTALDSDAAGTVVTGDIALRVKGDVGSRRITISVYGSSADSKITVGKMSRLNVKILDGNLYLNNMLEDSDKDGTYTKIETPFWNNSLRINLTGDPSSDFVYLSFFSFMDKYTFSGDSQVAHFSGMCPELPIADAGEDLPVSSETVLDGSTSSSPNGSVTTYRWELTNQNDPSIRYYLDGKTVPPGNICPATYDVTLTVTDSNNLTDSDTRVLTVTEGSCDNLPPIADAGPDLIEKGDRVVLDGSGSHDPDGTIVSWEWVLTHKEYPEGNRVTHGETIPVANCHGMYDVLLIVTDNKGVKSYDHMTILFYEEAMDTNAVLVTLTSPTIMKCDCEKAGAVTFSFEPGSIIAPGDILYVDLPKGVEICKPIDYLVVGNANAGKVKINENEMDAALFDPGTGIDATSLTFQSIAPLTLIGFWSYTNNMTVIDELAIRVKAVPQTNRIIVSVYGSTPDAKIIVGDGNRLNLRVFDSITDRGNILKPSNELGVYDQKLEGPIENTLMVDASHFANSDLLNVSFFSLNNKYVFTGDAQIAHVGASWSCGDGPCGRLKIYYPSYYSYYYDTLLSDIYNGVLYSSDELYLLSEACFQTGDLVSREWTLEHRTNPEFNRAASGESIRMANMEAGVYDITFTVTTWLGLTYSETMVLTVTDAPKPQPPVAVAGPDQTVFKGDEVTLDGSGSFCENGEVTGGHWTLIHTTNQELNRYYVDGLVIKLADLEPGVYNVRLSAHNNINGWGSDTMVLTVNERSIPKPPIADAGPDQTVYKYKEFDLDGSGSSDEDGEIVSWEWTLEHTTKPELNKTVSGPVITFWGIEAGTYHVTLKVTDNEGLTGEDEMMLTIKPLYLLSCAPNAYAAGGSLPAEAWIGDLFTSMILPFIFVVFSRRMLRRKS